MKTLYLIVFLFSSYLAAALVAGGESLLAIPMCAAAGAFLCLILRAQRA